jgi:hypothetical protein
MAVGSFPASRLRQAGVSAARIAAIQATYAGWSASQQRQFRAWIATNPDETIRSTYDPDGAGYIPPDTPSPVTDAAVAAVVDAPLTAARLKAAYGRQMVVVAPAPTGVAATDRANLVTAIAAVPAGGKLLLPGDATLAYVIDQALVITKNMTIEGVTLSETWKDQSNSGALNHPVGATVAGAVIQQATAATDVIQITGAASSVHLRNLGLTFAAAIAGNTGHGVNATPPTYGGGGHQSGLLSAQWENVVVSGHDGNHYAFYLLNSMYCTLRHLRSYSGGGLYVECDSFEGNFGNLVVEHIYVDLIAAGSANGVHLASRQPRGASAGLLNMLTFVRPQVNLTSAAATQGTQAPWKSNGGANEPDAVVLLAPDLEVQPTSSGSVADFGSTGGTTVIRGGLVNKVPANGIPGVTGYKLFTSSGSFTVPGGVTQVRFRVVGGGGGGGGAGSALTSGGVTNQVGGAGGGCGAAVDGVKTVVPFQTLTITVGAAGTSGPGGAANGAAGTVGGNGGQSQIDSDNNTKASGGGGGAGSTANSSTAASGGYYARGGNTSAANVPGFGGNAQSPNGLGGIQIPPGMTPGAGGGAANATLGGGAGGANGASFPSGISTSGGSQGASATANGVNGQTATASGSGGGGGGGGAPGGTGGNGGAGAAGQIGLWW